MKYYWLIICREFWMDIKQLAASYLETKLRKDEKRRQIDYDYAGQLRALKQAANTVDGKVAVLKKQGEINAEEELHEQYDVELKNLSAELKPLLEEVNATRMDPLRVNVSGNIHFDTFLEDGEIVSPGYFELIRR